MARVQHHDVVASSRRPWSSRSRTDCCIASRPSSAPVGAGFSRCRAGPGPCRPPARGTVDAELSWRRDAHPSALSMARRFHPAGHRCARPSVVGGREGHVKDHGGRNGDRPETRGSEAEQARIVVPRPRHHPAQCPPRCCADVFARFLVDHGAGRCCCRLSWWWLCLCLDGSVAPPRVGTQRGDPRPHRRPPTALPAELPVPTVNLPDDWATAARATAGRCGTG